MRSTLSVFFFVGVMLSLAGLGDLRLDQTPSPGRSRWCWRPASSSGRWWVVPSATASTATASAGRRPRGLHGLGDHPAGPFARLTLRLAVGREVADPDAGAAARRSSRTGRRSRFALIAPVGRIRLPGCRPPPSTASREPRHQAHHPGARGSRGGARCVLRPQSDHLAERHQGRRPDNDIPALSATKTFDYRRWRAHDGPGDLRADPAGRWSARPDLGRLRRRTPSSPATRTSSTTSSTARSGSPTVRASTRPTSRSCRDGPRHREEREDDPLALPGPARPVVVTVWNAQLDLKGPDDPRLATFLGFYGDGHTAPGGGVRLVQGRGARHGVARHSLNLSSVDSADNQSTTVAPNRSRSSVTSECVAPSTHRTSARGQRREKPAASPCSFTVACLVRAASRGAAAMGMPASAIAGHVSLWRARARW